MSGPGLNPAQRAAVDCRKSACVLAGAGSGKTLTLVEAIAGRLEAGLAEEAGPDEKLDISQILALTFTDKAAAELRQRLAGAFAGRRRQAEAEGRLDQADFWRGQAARLDRADIGTIHSYAFKLVRENALQLGLAAGPDLDPDEAGLGRDLGELFLDWLDKDKGKGDPELLRLLKHYPPSALKEMLTICAARLGSWGLSRLSASPPVTAEEAAGRLAAFGSLVRQTLDQIRNGAIDPQKKYYAPVREALESLAQLASAASLDTLEANFVKFRGLIQASGRWYAADQLKKGLVKALTDLEAAQGQCLVQPLLDDFLKLVNRLPEALARARARRGSINYDDILILARRLLATRPEVRRQETGRRRLIFIDEFQDTNRLQADLLAYLLLPPEDQAVYPEEKNLWERLDWGKAPPRFNAYGDPKQSIYRFRGAEVEIMAGFKKALAQGGGQVLALDVNYRSQTPLVDFFNALFPGQLEAHFTAQDRQEGERPPLYGGPHIVRLHAAGEPAATVLERAEEEALLAAAYLDRLFQGRLGVLVADGPEGGRPPRPGEVAVLFRRFRFAKIFQQAFLKAGWPVRLAQAGNPLDYAEGRGLLAAFSFLCGLDPELNLAAALRSPLGPVTDEALLGLVWPPDEPAAPLKLTDYFKYPRIRPVDTPLAEPAADDLSGPRPWPKDLAPDDQKILSKIRDLFTELAPLVGRHRPVEILERLVEERRLLPLAALEPDSEARARALTGFLALSRTLGRMAGRSFLSPAEELAELARNQGGRSGLEYQGEAITLSTIHSAKGLEFPVVLIAESDAPPRARTPRLLTSGDGRLALNWRPAGLSTPPASYLALAEEEDRLDKMENRRLFYVAATRARDHLVFLGRPKPPTKKAGGEADTWFQAVLNCPEAAALSQEFVIDPAEFSESSGSAPGPIRPTRPLGQGETLNLIPPMILNGASSSATELAHCLTIFSNVRGGSGGLAPPIISYPPATPGSAGGLAARKEEAGSIRSSILEPPAPSASTENLTARETGLLFHAVMEILDPLAPYTSELLAAEAARLGFSPKAAAALAAPIEAFLAGPWGRAWHEAASAGRAVFREWPFQLRLSERGGQTRRLTVNGVIDLFFQTPGGSRLVDYKFAAFPDGRGAGGPINPLAVYENQVRLYALALQIAGLAENLQAVLYFAGGSRPRFHEVDLETAWPPEFWEDFFNFYFFQPGFQSYF